MFTEHLKHTEKIRKQLAMLTPRQHMNIYTQSKTVSKMTVRRVSFRCLSALE